MTQAVVLVPGFFGFDHLGNDTYFADRFVAGLWVALNRKQGGEPYRVVAVPTIGIGTLAQRQAKLIVDLRTISGKLGARGDAPSRWHLVGHSTGGVDAAFLTRTQPLRQCKKGHSEFDPGKPPPSPVRIASVTTIAAPYYGSTLALSDLARLSEGEPRGVRGFARGLEGLGQGFVNALRGGFNSKFWFALGAISGRNQMYFLYHLLGADGLGLDLHPNVVSTLTETDNATGVPHFSIATFAPPPPPAPDAGVDPLFRQIWTLTDQAAKSGANACELLVPPPAFPEDPRPLIRSAGQPDPAVDSGSNDGVVNTNRQFLDGTLAGLVVGDHGDVLGQYRREDLTDGKPIVDGLLTSGANFHDTEFFELIRLVAEGILKT